MSPPALLLLGSNYALVMSLPVIFFEKRDERLGPMWWVNAVPFILLPPALLLAGLGVLPPLFAYGSAVAELLATAAVVPSAVSIGLVAAALATHRVPLAQWHQREDRPGSIVTHGPYARVRHPFYLAYLLLFLAAAMTAPGVATLGLLAYAALALNHTAAREERHLCASILGAAYRAYMVRTGRFIPVRAGTARWLSGPELGGRP